MRKDKLEYISICLNENANIIKLLRENNLLTQEDKEELLRRYSNLTPEQILKKKGEFDPEFILLKGKKGEIAYARNDSSYNEPNKTTLITELPLSFIKEGRKDPRQYWIDIAFEFFKPLFILDREVIEVGTGKTFVRITKKPYKKSEHISFDSKDPTEEEKYFITRSIKYSSIKEKTKENLSKKTQHEKKHTKLLCFLFFKKMNMGFRKISRKFNINKDTAKNWITEVENWSKEEKEAVMNELINSKSYSNIDLMDLPSKNFVSLSKIAYGLTPKGLYKTGRKLKPKIPYNKPED